MGATDFTTFVWTDADMTTAYRAACDEHGYDAYNGTISTTSGVSRVLDGHAMTEQGAQTVAGWLNNGLVGDARGNKWEDAKAIAIASDDAFTFATKTLRFTLDDLREYVESRVRELDDQWSRNYLRETLEKRPSALLWEFSAAKVPQAVALHTVHAVSTDFTPKFTLVTQRSSVPAVTRYEVVGDNGAVVHTTDTRALANAFIRGALTSESPRFTELGVRAVKAHHDMPSGVVARTVRKVSSAKITITVTVAAPRAKAPETSRKGWLFYGVASI